MTALPPDRFSLACPGYSLFAEMDSLSQEELWAFSAAVSAPHLLKGGSSDWGQREGGGGGKQIHKETAPHPHWLRPLAFRDANLLDRNRVVGIFFLHPRPHLPCYFPPNLHVCVGGVHASLHIFTGVLFQPSTPFTVCHATPGENFIVLPWSEASKRNGNWVPTTGLPLSALKVKPEQRRVNPRGSPAAQVSARGQKACRGQPPCLLPSLTDRPKNA